MVFAGGGTGGHLYPALAIAEAIKKQHREADILFLGTSRGVEANIVPEAGYELYLLPVQGLVRRLTWKNLLFPIRLLQSIVKCMKLYRHFDPHLVVGTGGYVSGPALLAALWMRIPCVIQEQNSYPGLVNRVLGRFVRAVFLTYEDSRRYFRRQSRLYVYGNPVRQSVALCRDRSSYEKFGFQRQRKTVLIFGGSQGARRLNEVVAETLTRLVKTKDWQFLWITGPRWYDRWLEYNGLGEGRIRVIPYLSDMSEAYAITDLAICRAGATTIAELTLCGIPAIYVPFPFATADHQSKNAESVVRAGGGLLIQERDLTADSLCKSLEHVLRNENLLNKMRRAARALARPEAASHIARTCLNIIRQESQVIKNEVPS